MVNTEDHGDGYWRGHADCDPISMSWLVRRATEVPLHSEHSAGDPVFEQRNVEVEEQTDLYSREPEVRVELGLVNG